MVKWRTNENSSTDKPDVAVAIKGARAYAEMYGDLKRPIYNERTGLLALTVIIIG